MRKHCSSTFGTNPVIQKNNQGSRNVSLCSRGPLFTLCCHSPAPWKVLPSGEDVLTIPTFKSGLAAPEHPAGLVRPFLLPHFFGWKPTVFLHLPSEEHWRQHLPQHGPKIALSLCLGGVWLEQRQSKQNQVLPSHPDTATRMWELGCCSQNKPWGDSGAQKSWSFVLICTQEQGCFLCLPRKCYRGKKNRITPELREFF